MAQADASGALIDLASAVRFEDLPESTVSATRRQILDYLAATMAGLTAEGCGAVRDLALTWGGRGEAQLIGFGDRVPAAMAALVNGTTGRAVELDDVHEQALTHSTVSMVPIALAVGSTVEGGLSGRDLITAVALGNDLAVRLALAVRGEFSSGGERRTMSLTYQTATLAGALVAARVAGSDREVVADSFGSAYSQVAGNLQGLKEGTLGVRVQQGLASFAAVTAWELARRGITGGRRPLEGEAGWSAAFHHGRFDPAPLVDGLGHEFLGEGISVKPYSCCRYGHNAIKAIAEARDIPGFDPARVSRIVATVQTQDLWDLLCEPLSLKADPDAFQGPSAMALSQFSLPYMLATAAAYGTFTTSHLPGPHGPDELVRHLMRHVDVTNEDRTLVLADMPTSL